ncbi:hypothetical protein [Photobacterium damselae]|uniref:Uncharacterized protein n=1 Tax=Photobacterium damselae TaxID=38293 RepID=A0ABD6X7M9_PHODM|nr:hypothetical protein [Photobacterium damselae]OBU43851.1 hypothetical protein AYY27_04465 [Photobacterium damselae]PSU18741.1 hypothetical protein CTM90_01810 [Photobacterium damselae]
MKKLILLSSCALLSSGVFANEIANGGFDLNLSPDGNSYVFSKTDAKFAPFQLIKQTDEHGDMYYIFKPSEAHRLDPTPLPKSKLWFDTTIRTQTPSGADERPKAREICSNLHKDDRVWRLPTFDDIQGAVNGQDMSAFAAFHPTVGGSILNFMLTDDGIYGFSNFPEDMTLIDTSEYMGVVFPKVVCVSDPVL